MKGIKRRKVEIRSSKKIDEKNVKKALKKNIKNTSMRTYTLE